MGRLVDRLVADGADERTAELEIWALMQERQLTPHGFACRVIRKSGQDGATKEQRTYEFVLIPWSPDRDHQLDLGFKDPAE